MLHEALSASSDAARLDHAHPEPMVPDDMRLGAELDGAPPEVRTAAVIRSRRLPEPSVMRSAWASLPVGVRDRIGTLALTESFYSLASGLDPQALTLEAGRRCEQWHGEALNGITAIASAALPTLYGTPEAEPLWAQRDFGAVVFPAETHPSQVTHAIAAHIRTEKALAAVQGFDRYDPVRVAAAEGEGEAYRAVIASPLRDPPPSKWSTLRYGLRAGGVDPVCGPRPMQVRGL